MSYYHIAGLAKDISWRTLQLASVAYCLQEYVVQSQLSEGFSMTPTLAHHGDWLVGTRIPVCRLSYYISRQSPLQYFRSDANGNSALRDQSMGTGLAVGDIVNAVHPYDPSKMVCKRILGLPGDTVLFDPRIMPLRQHDSEWSARTSAGAKASRKVMISTEPVYIVVPKGHIWLVGDNLGNSTDSRHYGPVPMALIKGKIFARYNCSLWPPRFGGAAWLRNPMQRVDEYD